LRFWEKELAESEIPLTIEEINENDNLKKFLIKAEAE